MSIINYQVNSTSVASVLLPKANDQPPRVCALIQNNGSANVYLGPSTVDTTGYIFYAGEEKRITSEGPNARFFNRDALYVVAADDTGVDIRAIDFRETR